LKKAPSGSSALKFPVSNFKYLWLAFSSFALHFGFAITAGIAMLIIGLSIILALLFLRMLLDHKSDRLQQEEI